MSDWGERSIAVSPDVKQYLIDKYRMPSDNIDLTINGIDTKRFSKNIDSNAVKRELGLIGRFRVVCVSRIDTEAAMHAFLLCDAAEALYKEIPGFELLIVGGGTAFEALKTRADEVNRILSSIKMSCAVENLSAISTAPHRESHAVCRRFYPVNHAFSSAPC